jgi:hypothetical protein
MPERSFRKINFFSSVILLALIIFSMTGCEKDIDVDIPATDTKLVVEGAVENGENPFVFITNTLNYFGTITTDELIKSVVLDATVTVSDGNLTDTMKLAPSGVQPLVIYYKAQKMKGEVGKTYSLKIQWKGNTYTSSTYIPTPVKLDSIWFRPMENDTLGYIWANFNEPPGTGNAYRWFAKRMTKDKRFLPTFGSAFEDKFIDGKKFELRFPRGREPQQDRDEDNGIERNMYRKGDTVIAKFCTIPMEVFKFYRSYQQQATANGNPFAAPSTIKTNMSNGALGVWAGYGAWKDTVILK